MSASAKWSLVACVTILLFAGMLVTRTLLTDDMRRYAAPGFESMTVNQLSEESHLVLPAMLATVYRAFGETDEASIYDGLAEVSADEALEALYLERMGAMAEGGLEQSDQQVHSMQIIRLTSRPVGTTINMDAEWQVVGTVGHATHMHVRGNTYAARLTLQPVDGAWRITAFDLTDVDRAGAGTIVEGPVD